MKALSIARVRELVEAARSGAARRDDLGELYASVDGLLNLVESVFDPVAPAPVAVDTREQLPFEPYVWIGGERVKLPTERVTLGEGDYAPAGLEQHLRIERKSVSDLYGTLVGSASSSLGEAMPGRERFRAELVRLAAYPRRYIVVEGTRLALISYIKDHGRKADPMAILWLAQSMAFDHGVPLVWCESRSMAEWFVGQTISRVYAQATDPKAAKKARARGLGLPWLHEEPKP